MCALVERDHIFTKRGFYFDSFLEPYFLAEFAYLGGLILTVFMNFDWSGRTRLLAMFYFR